MPRRAGVLAGAAWGGAVIVAIAATLRWGAGWGRLETAPAITVTRAYADFSDALRRNETFAHVLTRAGLPGREQVALLKAATALELRRLRAGQIVVFRRPLGQALVDRVMLRISPERRVWLRRAGGDSGWLQTEELIPWTAAQVLAGGTIDRTLYDALDSGLPDTLLPRGERIALAWAIADVYDWGVDFTRDVRPGDHVQVLFERLESPDGERRFGRVLAAKVDVAGAPSYAFYFEATPGQGAFYDEQGRSLRRAFLRAPLEFRRISSRFGGRFHPILRRWRSHQGTDYAADRGTPVRVTADGMVTTAGWNGGLGIMVEVRHANGIRTRYGHLSRLASGIRAGMRVTQRQTVGYVGSTGLSTAPHLHYEFLVNGRPTNPQRKDAGSGRPVPAALRVRYDEARDQLLAALAPPVRLAGHPATTPTRVD